MIKKDYQKPTMRVVKIQQHGIICTSPATLTGPNNSGNGSQEDDWYDLE